jgi:hypothetical protein
MNTPLQHPIWPGEEMVIRNCQLIEDTGIPGSIFIRWIGAAGYDEIVLIGNHADDFLELYRAAPDAEARDLIMQHEIRKAAAR